MDIKDFGWQAWYILIWHFWQLQKCDPFFLTKIRIVLLSISWYISKFLLIILTIAKILLLSLQSSLIDENCHRFHLLVIFNLQRIFEDLCFVIYVEGHFDFDHLRWWIFTYTSKIPSLIRLCPRALIRLCLTQSSSSISMSSRPEPCFPRLNFAKFFWRKKIEHSILRLLMQFSILNVSLN